MGLHSQPEARPCPSLAWSIAFTAYPLSLKQPLIFVDRSLCFLLGGIIGTLHYKFFICFILASIAKELSVQSLCSADRLAFAGSKLARRVAKLQQQKDSATPQVAKAIDSLFLTYGKVFNGALELVNAKLAEMWASIRTRVTKTILPLPRRADSESTNLSLLHSVSLIRCAESTFSDCLSFSLAWPIT